MFGTGNTFGSVPTPMQIAEFECGSEVISLPFLSFSQSTTETGFELILTVAAGCPGLLIAGYFRRTGERAVLPSIFLSMSTSASNDDSPLVMFKDISPQRSVEFRTCRFEQCDVGLKSGPALPAPSTGFNFGTPAFGQQAVTPVPPALANQIVFKFSAATLIVSEALSRRDARSMPNLAQHPTRPDLPNFPGVSLIRSFERNLQFTVTWNLFSVGFTNRTYWLYPRRFRLIFRTILMIRKFRNHTGLGRLDMNVVRNIFDLIATPRPLLLPTPVHEQLIADERARFKEMLAEGDTKPRFTFGSVPYRTLGIEVTQPKLPFGFSFGAATPAVAAQPQFGQPAIAFGQPAQPAGGLFGQGAAQPAFGGGVAAGGVFRFNNTAPAAAPNVVAAATPAVTPAVPAMTNAVTTAAAAVPNPETTISPRTQEAIQEAMTAPIPADDDDL